MRYIIENYLIDVYQEEAKQVSQEQKEILSKKLKRLFLLTDGEVDSPGLVIELAKKNADKVKIHSFGIGIESG